MNTKNAGSIFILEDVELVATAYARALSPLGQRIVVARSIGEARNLIASWSEKPCICALLNERLEDGFGTDLLPLPTSFVSARSTAVVSGFLDMRLVLRAAAAHAMAVPKPVESSTLVSLVRFLEGRTAEPPEASARYCSEGRREMLPRRRRFGAFVLHGQQLFTPSRVVWLRAADAQLLEYLVDAGGDPRRARTIANDLYPGSRDRGEQLVRRHIADLRRSLGEFSGIVRRCDGGGYCVATHQTRAHEFVMSEAP